MVTLQNTLLNNKKNQVQTEAKLDKTCEVTSNRGVNQPRHQGRQGPLVFKYGYDRLRNEKTLSTRSGVNSKKRGQT